MKRGFLIISFFLVLMSSFLGASSVWAQFSLDPANLDFGNQDAFTQSASQTVTIENVGANDLLVDSTAFAGNNPDQFLITEDNCTGQTLSTGNQCEVDVAFFPQGVSAFSGSFVVSAQDLTTFEITSDGIPLTGTGVVNPSATVTPSSISFGNVGVGITSSSRVVQLINEGTTDLTFTSVALGTGTDYVILNETCSDLGVLPAGADCLVEVQFVPTTLGVLNDTLDFTTDGGNPSVNLSGSGISGPSAEALPAALSFGTLTVGQQDTRVAQLTNVGTDDLTITSVSLSGVDSAQFTIVSDGCMGAGTLAPGTDCLVEVQFHPDSAAAFVASLDFATDGGDVATALSGTGAVGPVATVTPGSLAFGSLGVGSSSNPQFVQVTNTGVSDLSVSQIQLTGTDPGEFSIYSETCTANAIPAGGNCLVIVVFAPTGVGAFSADLEITSDAPSSPDTVSLTGTGVQGSILSSGAVAFGNVTIHSTSAPSIVTITNTSLSVDLQLGNLQQIGANTANFNIQNDNCSNQTILAGGANECTFEVTFTPNAVAAFTDTILIPNDSATPNFTVALSGSGIASDLGISGASIFGNVQVNTVSSSLLVTVTNSGDTDAQVGTVSIAGAYPDQFQIVEDNCSNSAVADSGGTCTISVACAPTTSGAKVASLQVPSDDPVNPLLTSVLSCTGTTSSLEVSSALDFGNVGVGVVSSAQTITVTNSGIDSANLGAVVIVGSAPDQFEIVEDNCSNSALAGGGADCTIDVSFIPSVLGVSAAVVQIPSDDPNTPVLTVGLTGTGVSPSLNLSTNTITFTDIPVGSTATAQTVTLSNTSLDAQLPIGELIRIGANTANFNILNDGCSNQTLSIAGGGSDACSFDIEFTPNAVGNFSDRVEIPNGDLGTPLATVDISGNGVAPSLEATPNPVDFGDVPIGSVSAAQVITVTNTSSDASAHLGALNKIGANTANFNIQNDLCSNATVAPLGTCTFEVVFSPDNIGAFTDTVQIPSDDPSGPLTVDLEGTGVENSISGNTPVFADTRIHTSSATQTITITNASAIADAVIATVSLSGDNPDQFTITQDDCSNSVVAAQGGTCTLGIAFSPESEGTFNAIVTVPNNATASPLNIPITGNGIAPVLSITPVSPFDFGNTPVGELSTAQIFTVENTGPADLLIDTLSLVGDNPTEFAIVEDNCTQVVVPSNVTCTFTAVFAPSQAGALTATVVIPSNDPNTPVTLQVLTGTGDVSEISVAPVSPFDFGTVPVFEESVAQTLTITNNGDAPLNIGTLSFVGLNPDMFFLSLDECTNVSVAPAGTCEVDVVFFPLEDVSYTAQLSIPSNDPTTPVFLYTVTGAGLVPGITATPSSLGFGNQDVNTVSEALTVTVSNAGDADLTIASTNIVGTNPNLFSIVQDGCGFQVLTPGDSCQMDLVFQPDEAGTANANLVFFNDDPSQPFLSVLLTGTGVIPGIPQLQFSPTVLDFDNIKTGQQEIQNVVLTNVGTGNLSISNISIGGVNPDVFSQSSGCVGEFLGEGESCQVSVSFLTSDRGNFNGLLLITSNASAQSDFVVLIGSTPASGGCSLSQGETTSSSEPWMVLFVAFSAIVMVVWRWRFSRS